MRHENDLVVISSATLDAAIESARRLHLLAAALDADKPRAATRSALLRKVQAVLVQLAGASADKTESGRWRRCNLAGVRLAESYALALSVLDRSGEASDELIAVLVASNELAGLLGVELPPALPVAVETPSAEPVTVAGESPIEGLHDEEGDEGVSEAPEAQSAAAQAHVQPLPAGSGAAPLHALDPPASVGHT
jgi:hypothetical protein